VRTRICCDAHDGKPFEFDRIKSRKAFRTAKSQFEKLHPASRPDSLTRRGDILIARRSYTPWRLDPERPSEHLRWKQWAIEDWQETVQRVLPEANILDISIDQHRNVRAYFHLLNDEMVTWLREIRPRCCMDTGGGFSNRKKVVGINCRGVLATTPHHY